MNAPAPFRDNSEMNVLQFKTKLTDISWSDLEDITSNTYDTIFDRFSTAYNSCFL